MKYCCRNWAGVSNCYVDKLCELDKQVTIEKWSCSNLFCGTLNKDVHLSLLICFFALNLRGGLLSSLKDLSI